MKYITTMVARIAIGAVIGGVIAGIAYILQNGGLS